MKFDMGQLDSIKITVIAEDKVPYESVLLGQHGISFLVEAIKDDTIVRILVDVGQNPKGLLYNMEHLNIEPSSIDMVVLTHCHWDHTLGLSEIVASIGKDNLPIVAHPSVFKLNFITKPYLKHLGIVYKDKQGELEKYGGKLFLVSEPLELMEGLITSGEIQRQTDFESTGMTLFTLENGKVECDQMKDDLTIIANVTGKGLVIITGCSHAGIINICKHAIKITGVNEIAAVMGGFHLIEASNERISKTVESFIELSPNLISAGHCTGINAEFALKSVFKERFKQMSSGTIYDIAKE